MHCIDLPLADTKPLNPVLVCRKLRKEIVSKNVIKQVPIRDRHLISKLIALETEIDWLEKTLSTIKTKVVLAHHDMNFLNVLVRDDVTEDSDKIMLIDFEYSTFGYRGSDLGSHFNDWRYNFSNLKNIMSGADYPSESKRREFVVEYLNELRTLDIELDDDNDSIEAVMLEAEFFTLVSTLRLIFWLYRDYDFWKELDYKHNSVSVS